jgi:hypothetical protein
MSLGGSLAVAMFCVRITGGGLPGLLWSHSLAMATPLDPAKDGPAHFSLAAAGPVVLKHSF